MTPVWWLLGFLPALLALYFLKLKRRDVAVSSTLLWKRSLEDLHVNSPFQKLRKSLLFLLQLLILIVLIAAIWRPRCDVAATGGRNLLLFLDISASMKARESDGTRFDLAKKEALTLVESMSGTDRMMLVTFASRTTTVQPLTADRALLTSKIAALTPTSLSTDLVAALSTAYSLADTLPTADVYVLGDGCYGDLSTLPPEVKGLNFRFVAKATPLDNVGIVEADIRRTFGSVPRTEVFALIRNSSKEARELTVSLYHEERLVDAQPRTVAAGEASAAIFDVTELSAGLVRVELDGGDVLGDDDRAYLEISPPGRVSVVLVAEAGDEGDREDRWLEWALLANADLSHRRVSRQEFLSPSMKEELRGSEPPVVIYDGWTPEEVPDVPAIFIGCHPPLPEGMAEPKLMPSPEILEWDRSHPVNRFLSFNTILIAESLVFEDSAPEHFRSLVEADHGSIIGVTTRETEGGGTVQSLIVGFDIAKKSDWPLGHHAFPIFFANALNWLGRRYDDSKARWRTGEPLVYGLKGSEDREKSPHVEMRLPDGTLSPAAVEKSGAVVFSKSDTVGIYELFADSEPQRRFGVSLLSERESQLRPLEKIDFGGDFSVVTESELGTAGRDLWAWFALLALAIMLLEWYVYHRRVYV